MPVEWALSIMDLIYKRKGDIWNCSCYRAEKCFEHGMKVVKMIFEKRLCGIVTVDEMKFGFMPESRKLMLCLS